MKYRVFKKKSLQKQHSNLFLSGVPWESPEVEGGTTGGGNGRERPLAPDKPPGPPAPARPPPPPPRPCPTGTEDRDTC